MKSTGFGRNSIQFKIVLWVGLCIVVMAGIIIGYSAITSRQEAVQAAEEYTVALAQKEAEVIKSELNVAMDSARAMADALASVAAGENQLTRDQVNGMLKQILAENPQFLGVYTLWEPDKFDGKDAEFANTNGHDETGRLIPYWARTASGEIVMEPLVDYETEGIGDWYLCPKNTKQECIQDPFLYPIQGVDVLMTSLTVPVMADGEFFGIVGVDLGLEFLQEVADSINAYDGQSTLALISNNGTLAGVTGQPELVGEPATAIHADFEEDFAVVSGGQSVSEIMDDNLEIFEPIFFGETTTPWSANLLVPRNLIIADANSIMWKEIGIALIPAVIALVLVWLIARQIAKPIVAITAGAKYLSEGDIHLEGIDQKQIEAINQREDELGEIGKAFNELIVYFQEMAEAAQMLADGDLTAEIEPKSNKDVLGKAFRQMIDNLRELIGQLTDSANAVGAASNQLSAAAGQAGQATEQIATTVQQIANGAQEQTESTTRTAESVDQMARAIDGVAKGGQEQAEAVGKAADVTAQISKVIQDVAEAAQQGAGVSAQAADTARKGSETVESNLQAMGVIKNQVDFSAEKVAEMGQRSEEIGVIVETIDDIASQTNLLALNAAIEAARAGEHGEGFAVVADEVRKLAEESTAATSEIANLIKNIQETVAEAVKAMESSATEVDHGVEGANEAGQALREILTAAEEVNQQVENIAAASEELSASADELVSSNDAVSAVVEENTAATEEMSANSSEVTEAIETITSISEENSAAVEEVSASAEEMNAQVEEVTASAHSLADMATDLTMAVSQFKLGAGQSLISQIDLFKQAHISWVDKLNDMLAGREHLTVDQVGSHETCMLGKWYYDQGRDFQGMQEYDSLEDPHIRLHKEVAQIVSKFNQGDTSSASSGVKTVEALSHTVVNTLDDLEHKALDWLEKSKNGKAK